MGMAASQARLLSITARLSDNEQSGQALSYAKERLADRSDQITAEYNDALKATKLQIMTGYSDGAASYTDISFDMLTSPAVVETLGKQYIATDTQGRVLVSEDVADAFAEAHGSLNAFLGALGTKQGGPYSLSDIDPSKKASDGASFEMEDKIHEAWDVYFNSIGKTFGSDDEDDVSDNHLWTFDYVETGNEIGQGYATITVASTDPAITNQPINFEGTNDEQLELYNYALAITESYYSDGTTTIVDGVNVTYNEHDFTTVNTQYNKGNSAMTDYYSNLYYKMLSSGYYTYTDTPAKANNDDHYLYENKPTYLGASSQTTKGTPLDDSNTFEEYLRNGDLILETYSVTEGKFVSTSISEDTCIQEVEDETQIAIAQANYENDLKQIQRLDSRYDLQIKQLDTEHNTLQTEYESVKNVITKNVEKSFQTFG